jgi:MOSC domain-containing protein YiiM
LIAGHGIEGDDKDGRSPRRQLNLLSYEWLRERKKEGYKTKPGSFGEQLIIKGMAVENLQRVDRLQPG